MKKLILAILAVGSVATVQAQKPGSILLYGNVGINTAKQTNDAGIPGAADITNRATTITFAPGVGYQFNKHFTVGAQFAITSWKQTTDAIGGIDYSTRDLKVGAFFRHTVSLNKTFFLFHQFELSYLNGNEVTETSGPGGTRVEDIYDGFCIGWWPAVGINFTPSLALNFSLGGIDFDHRKWDFDGSPATSRESILDVNFGRQFNVGISANLGGSHAKKKHIREPRHRHHVDMNDSDED